MNEKKPRDSTPPPVSVNEIRLPNPAIYQAIGQQGVQTMIRDFYRGLAQSPIADMFPSDEEDLIAAADKSALFWVTALGGPPLYFEKYGHPRMRARHLPFSIDQSARDHWFACWEIILDTAVEKYGIPAEHMEGLRSYIRDFSSWMINS